MKKQATKKPKRVVRDLPVHNGKDVKGGAITRAIPEPLPPTILGAAWDGVKAAGTGAATT